MMIMARRLALILGVAAVAAPALGAPQRTGTSDELSVLALHNYSACAVKRTPEGAARLLDLDEKGAAYKAELARFAKGHNYCMNNGRIAFGGLLFQGALAEALVAQRYAGRPLASAASAASTLPKARSEPEAIGLCLVRKRPDAATALLQSQPASEAEHAALNQTVNVLPACVVSGMTMKMNRSAVRAMMALGAYRLLAGNTNPAES
jgi:hypothetical protein